MNVPAPDDGRQPPRALSAVIQSVENAATPNGAQAMPRDHDLSFRYAVMVAHEDLVGLRDRNREGANFWDNLHRRLQRRLDQLSEVVVNTLTVPMQYRCHRVLQTIVRAVLLFPT